MESRQRHQKTSSQTGGGSGRGRLITAPELLNSCLRLLSVRPRSVGEITAFLKRKTADTDLIDQTIHKLQTLKFLDDRKFAQWLIESRSRSRPRGKRLLSRELMAKGIDPSVIDTASSGVNELELASRALAKKQNIWSSLPARDFRQRAVRYLQSRGFSWDVIERVVKKGYNTDDVS